MAAEFTTPKSWAVNAGFVEINIQDEISTMLGTMTIYSAVKPLN